MIGALSPSKSGESKILYNQRNLGSPRELSHTPTTMPPNHLIIVCGHAIWLGGPQDGWDESEWLIEGYKKGETPTFIEHIKAGVKLLSQDEDAVLVFSG
jgi:folylpolyglutamate synthase